MNDYKSTSLLDDPEIQKLIRQGRHLPLDEIIDHFSITGHHLRGIVESKISAVIREISRRENFLKNQLSTWSQDGEPVSRQYIENYSRALQHKNVLEHILSQTKWDWMLFAIGALNELTTTNPVAFSCRNVNRFKVKKTLFNLVSSPVLPSKLREIVHERWVKKTTMSAGFPLGVLLLGSLLLWLPWYLSLVPASILGLIMIVYCAETLSIEFTAHIPEDQADKSPRSLITGTESIFGPDSTFLLVELNPHAREFTEGQVFVLGYDGDNYWITGSFKAENLKKPAIS